MSKQQVNNKELQAQDTTVMLEKYIEDELILYLTRTGTHSDLF